MNSDLEVVDVLKLLLLIFEHNYYKDRDNSFRITLFMSGIAHSYEVIIANNKIHINIGELE